MKNVGVHRQLEGILEQLLFSHRLPVVLVGNKADLSPDRYGNLWSSRQRKVSWTRNQACSSPGSATDLNQSFHHFLFLT